MAGLRKGLMAGLFTLLPYMVSTGEGVSDDFSGSNSKLENTVVENSFEKPQEKDSFYVSKDEYYVDFGTEKTSLETCWGAALREKGSKDFLGGIYYYDTDNDGLADSIYNFHLVNFAYNGVTNFSSGYYYVGWEIINVDYDSKEIDYRAAVKDCNNKSLAEREEINIPKEDIGKIYGNEFEKEVEKIISAHRNESVAKEFLDKEVNNWLQRADIYWKGGKGYAREIYNTRLGIPSNYLDINKSELGVPEGSCFD